MTLDDAQADMRHGYYSGSPGLAASAGMWLAAAGVAASRGPRAGLLVLVVGGVLIHPLAIAVSKLLGRPGTHAKGNPLGFLALEGTAILLLGVLLSLGLSQLRTELFFPAMLWVIGGRYLTFQTLYGRRAYWLCGGCLAAAGFAAAVMKVPASMSAFAGGGIEAAFAVALFRLDSK